MEFSSKYDNGLILEFARLNSLNDKYIPSSQYEIILHDGNETGKHNIPHFHVNSRNGEFNISVKILNHNPKIIDDIEILEESGKINNKRKFLEKLLNWLNNKSEIDITNMELLYSTWNERFEDMRLPIWIENKKTNTKKFFDKNNEYFYLNICDFEGSHLPYNKYYVFIDISDPIYINIYDIEKDETLIINNNVDKNNSLYKLYELWLKDICYSDKDFDTNEEYVGYMISTSF